MGSSIKTNSWILIGNSTEAASFESNTWFAWLIFVFIPNFLSQVSWKSRAGGWFKESFKVVKTFGSLMFLEMINNWFWLWCLLNFWLCYWSRYRSFFSFWFFLDCCWFRLSFRLSFNYWRCLLYLSWSTWCSNWDWSCLCHLWRLWLKSSSLNFLFCNNTGSRELLKITTLINCLCNS